MDAARIARAGMLILVSAALAACPTRSPSPLEERVEDASASTQQGLEPRIILLIGDGMGRGQLEAASLYKSGAAESLHLYDLPVQGTITTSSPSGITDSAASATAMATGMFTLNGRVGLDLDEAQVKNLVELAQTRGLATGLVTTTRISHATPASFASHVKSRNQYGDIAAQMTELGPDIMLGGGRRDFEDRSDGRNLIDELRERGYQFVASATELAAAEAGESRKLLGLFADSHLPYVVDREEGDGLPRLEDMALAALERLDADPDGFFLMVEGGRIDHAGHGNHIQRCIGETLAFDDTVQAVVDWAGTRDDVTILVTADHETGGLQVLQNLGAGIAPEVSWRWGSHTNATIQLFGRGPGSEFFDGHLRDHRWIHSVLASRIRHSPTSPLPAILPNGYLGDLIGPSVAQTRLHTEDPATQLTRLTLASDERGLGIGLEGLFRWDQGATVVLIDIDYGLATGLRNLDSLADTEGSADAFLSKVELPAPADNGFGAELAFVTTMGLEPKLEQILDEAGLRGLTGRYGDPDDLSPIEIATNFSDRARSYGDTQEVSQGRGLEAFIRWQELYDGAEHPPEGARIAVWAVQVDDDGQPTNQSLPPWLDAAATRAPGPLVIEP